MCRRFVASRAVPPGSLSMCPAGSRSIVEMAVRHGLRHRLAEVRWSFTPQGPPEIGGLPSDLRNCFATLRGLIAAERRKVETIQRLGHEMPRWFH